MFQGPPGQNVTPMDEGGSPLLPDSLVYQVFLSLGRDVLAPGCGVPPVAGRVPGREFLWREQFYHYFQVARDVPGTQVLPALSWLGTAGLASQHRATGSEAGGWQGGPPAARAPNAALPQQPRPGSRFRRLWAVPCVEVQTLQEHTDQVLPQLLSLRYQFASCSRTAR